MCRIENNYIPPGPERYDKLEALIGSPMIIEFINNKDQTQVVVSSIQQISTYNQAEFIKLESNEEIRLDRIVSVRSA